MVFGVIELIIFTVKSVIRVYVSIQYLLTIKWSLITINSMYLVSSSTLCDTCGAWEETQFAIFKKNSHIIFSLLFSTNTFHHQGQFQNSKHKDQLMSHASPRKEKKQQINKVNFVKLNPVCLFSKFQIKMRAALRTKRPTAADIWLCVCVCVCVWEKTRKQPLLTR